MPEISAVWILLSLTLAISTELEILGCEAHPTHRARNITSRSLLQIFRPVEGGYRKPKRISRSKALPLLSSGTKIDQHALLTPVTSLISVIEKIGLPLRLL